MKNIECLAKCKILHKSWKNQQRNELLERKLRYRSELVVRM